MEGVECHVDVGLLSQSRDWGRAPSTNHASYVCLV